MGAARTGVAHRDGRGARILCSGREGHVDNARGAIGESRGKRPTSVSLREVARICTREGNGIDGNSGARIIAEGDRFCKTGLSDANSAKRECWWKQSDGSWIRRRNLGDERVSGIVQKRRLESPQDRKVGGIGDTRDEGILVRGINCDSLGLVRSHPTQIC